MARLHRPPLRGGARRGTLLCPVPHMRAGTAVGEGRMQIECSRCAARYEVADKLIGPAGKSVRCAKCGNVWLVRKPEPAATAEPVAWPELPQRTAGQAAADSAEDPSLAEYRSAKEETAKAGFAKFPEAPPEEPLPRGRFGVAAAVGWVVTVLTISAAAWVGYAHRDAVMEAWPPSERVYLALGLRR